PAGRKTMEPLAEQESEALRRAGAAPAALSQFAAAVRAQVLPARPGPETLAADARQAQAIFRAGRALLAGWPAKPARDPFQARGAETVLAALRRTGNAFGHSYAELIYRRLTDDCRRFLRADELVYAAAKFCPGLCPSPEEVAAELRIPLADKDG